MVKIAPFAIEKLLVAGVSTRISYCRDGFVRNCDYRIEWSMQIDWWWRLLKGPCCSRFSKQKDACSKGCPPDIGDIRQIQQVAIAPQ